MCSAKLDNKIGLVIEGGGTLGVAHVGALVRLQELGALKQFKYFAGSSVGSIISGALACGADAYIIKDIMESLDFDKFKDDSWNSIVDMARLLKKYGWYKGDYLQKWYREVINNLTGNPDITLAQIYNLYDNYLVITVFNVDKGKTEYYTPESRPDMPLHVAVRRSSGIPLFFEAVTSTPGKNGDPINSEPNLLVDGGWVDNLPTHTLNSLIPREQVLALKLVSVNDVYSMSHAGSNDSSQHPNNSIDFVFILMNSARNMAMKLHVHKDDWKRTIKINVGEYTSTDFDMSSEQKRWLYESGYNSVDIFIHESH